MNANTENPAITLPLLALIGSLTAAIYLVGMALDLTTVQLLVKGIPVLTMAAWVWLQKDAERRIAIGLVFGALGDILLNIPGAFLPGMMAFAIGHGLYVWAFWRWQSSLCAVLAIPVALYLAFGLQLMLPGTAELTVPVVGYMSIIGAMLWRAAVVGTASNSRLAVRWLPLAGALLFAFSDTLIGINRFAQPLPGSAFPIMLTYWAGQWLIAASALVRCQTAPSHSD